jgi:hypothetical protein
MPFTALFLGVAAQASAPLTINVADPAVVAVVLDCGGGSTQKAVVKNGKAEYLEVPNGNCSVVFVRKSGSISGAGTWTCSLDNCVQEDVHHLDISNADGRINIVIANVPPSTTLELNCPSGHRERSPLRENTGIFENVPNEPCTLLFKGGVASRYQPISWGTYYCSLSGNVAVCSQR